MRAGSWAVAEAQSCASARLEMLIILSWVKREDGSSRGGGAARAEVQRFARAVRHCARESRCGSFFFARVRGCSCCKEVVESDRKSVV